MPGAESRSSEGSFGLSYGFRPGRSQHDALDALHAGILAPSPLPRFPPPVAAKARPMPTHERFRLDNRYDLQDRRKTSIHLDEEPAVVVRETSPALQPTPQDHQLMPERGILSLKPDLRLEW
jgi:hypothetical protein